MTIRSRLARTRRIPDPRLPSIARPPPSIMLDILLLADAGLAGRQLLERHPVTGGQLEGVVDVATQFEHADPMA